MDPQGLTCRQSRAGLRDVRGRVRKGGPLDAWLQARRGQESRHAIGDYIAVMAVQLTLVQGDITDQHVDAQPSAFILASDHPTGYDSVESAW